MDDIRFGMYSRLTTLTEQYGYFVGETQDRTYAPAKHRNNHGDNQVTVLEQHKDGHVHIHSAELLLTGLNPYFLPGQMFQWLLHDFVR